MASMGKHLVEDNFIARDDAGMAFLSHLPTISIKLNVLEESYSFYMPCEDQGSIPVGGNSALSSGLIVNEVSPGKQLAKMRR